MAMAVGAPTFADTSRPVTGTPRLHRFEQSVTSITTYFHPGQTSKKVNSGERSQMIKKLMLAVAAGTVAVFAALLWSDHALNRPVRRD